MTGGLLPAQALRAAIAQGEIVADEVGAGAIGEDQVQPASLDLRLGEVAYRVPASFLPGCRATVMDKLGLLTMHEVPLGQGAVLERGCVYIVPLIERLGLRPGHGALANPKSSTGRLDVFARLITDQGTEFDRVREGYAGPLYAEISPRTFSICVRTGSRLLQLRVKQGAPRPDRAALERLQEQFRQAGVPAPESLRDGTIAVSVDLAGDGPGALIGYRAKKHTGLIDLDRIGHYAWEDFWEPMHARTSPSLVLIPDEFYILCSRERVVVPPDHAAEMLAYDTLVGEFRVHYAGFFDPGFGYDADGPFGTRAVLEVRSHDVPFLVEHGQIVGHLVYEPLLAVPDRLYGGAIGSSYQGQGLKLSKQFRG
jgi:dCTP deaminase